MARRQATRKKKKLFIIAAEGDTEDSYFRLLGELYNATIELKRKRNQNSAGQLLEEIKRVEKRYCKTKHEAWVVVDKDSNSDKELQEIQDWSQKEHCGFALSNPRFELWLLLHFLSYGEASKAISNNKEVLELQKHFLQYVRNKKIVNNGKINDTNINDAIREAQKFSYPPEICNNIGTYISAGNFTTVFRLVENIIATGTR